MSQNAERKLIAMFWRIEKKICLFLLVSLFALSFIAGKNESSRLAEKGAAHADRDNADLVCVIESAGVNR